MSENTEHPPLKAGLAALLIAFCLLLPNMHFSLLASPVVIPREFLLYFFSVVFIFVLAQREALRYNAFFALSLVFLFWQALSLGWSSDLPTGIEHLLNAYVFLLAAFSFYQIRNPQTLAVLLICLIASMTIACLIGLAQNFGVNPFGIHQARPPSSTFNNKNLAASAALLFLPAALGKLALSKSRLNKLAYSLASTSMLSYVLVCHTKGVWLAAMGLIGIALIAYLSRGQSEKQAINGWIAADKIHLLGIAAISLALFLAPGERSKDRLYQDLNSFAERSTNVRLGFYSDAIPLIKQHPIVGIGSGSLRRDFRAEPGGNYAVQHAHGNKYLSRLHNDHLQYLVEHGLLGLGLWLAMLVTLYRSATGFLKHNSPPSGTRVIGLSLLIGVTGMLLHALVSFPLRSVSTASLFWLAVGLLLAYQGNTFTHRSVRLPSAFKHLLVPLLLVLSVFAITHVMNRGIGSYYAKQASESLQKGNCFAAKLYLNNIVGITSLNLHSAQLLTITYDFCPAANPEEIAGVMDQVLEFEPNHSLALVVKGDAATELGDRQTAFDSYRRALGVNPLEQRAYVGSARLEAENGNREKALELLHKALAIEPENRAARELLMQLEKR